MFQYIYNFTVVNLKEYYFRTEPVSNLLTHELANLTSGPVPNIGDCSNLPLNVNELAQYLPSVNTTSDLTNTVAG